MTTNQIAKYRSYKLLEDDYLRICEFVEPSDLNLETYSHRIYELLLRLCTEFESTCKEVLISNDYQDTKPQNFTIKDYNEIFKRKYVKGLDSSLELLYWKDKDKIIQPFKDWCDDNPLSWYQDYNKVKHNRDSLFEKASFSNLTFAIAANFLLLLQIYQHDFFTPYNSTVGYSGSYGKGVRKIKIPGCIFVAVSYEA